jgi:hypothetical protein
MVPIKILEKSRSMPLDLSEGTIQSGLVEVVLVGHAETLHAVLCPGRANKKAQKRDVA